MKVIENNEWQVAELISSKDIASNMKAMVFAVSNWPGHVSGQHVDIRLTAPNGYVAERSYSIVSSPSVKDSLELGVELLEDGEVSPYLWQMKPGGQIEIRGPIGGHFVWNEEMSGPLILIAGGAGITPLISMIRHYVETKNKAGVRHVEVFFSARDLGRVAYKEELEKICLKNTEIHLSITITDNVPEDWDGFRGRINEEMMSNLYKKYTGQDSKVFVCGPTGFVEAASKIILSLGFDRNLIKTERFGG